MASHARVMVALLGVIASVAAGCDEPSSGILYSLTHPRALALACQSKSGEEYVAAPLAKCDGQTAGNRLLGFVACGSTGAIAIMDFEAHKALDNSATIPGYTPIEIGGYVADLGATSDSRTIYALDTAGKRAVAVNGTDFSITTISLGWEDEPLHLRPTPSRLLVHEDEDGQASLLVSFPAAQLIARYPLDAKGNPGQPVLRNVPGSPSAMAVSPAGLAVVGHLDHNYITRLDLDSAAEGQPIGLLPPCMDGLDNDGDGAIDREDPGCTKATDWDETDPVICGEQPETGCIPSDSLPECGNGLDDDGDELSDLADPGCLDREDGRERTDNPPCSDGVDNDGNGEIDQADDGECGGAEAAEDREPELEAYPCHDGVDNDGDSLTDLQDPSCFSAGAVSEWDVPPPNAELALSDDGKWAYVGHRGYETVVVVDLTTARVVDVNSDATDDSAIRRMRALRGQYSIDLFSAPMGFTMQQKDEKLYAYVSDSDGRLTRIVVEEKGDPVHRTDVAESTQTAASYATQPRLYDNGVEVKLGYSPEPGYPSLGPLQTKTDPNDPEKKIYYGIRFNDDLSAHRNETWSIVYEGRLPGSDALKARLLSPTDVAVSGGDLCALGALPGDLFVLKTGAETGCEEIAPLSSFDFSIVDVGPDWVLLDPGGYTRIDESGEKQVPVTDPACFSGTLDFEIRPEDAYTVVGSRSGFLHNVVASPEGCRLVGPNPDFTGRARAARWLSDKPATECPITEADTEFIETRTFVNPIFSLNVFPACMKTAEQEIVEVVPPRGSEWRFAVASGYAIEQIKTGKLSIDQELQLAEDVLYVLDLAERAIKSVTLSEFKLGSGYY